MKLSGVNTYVSTISSIDFLSPLFLSDFSIGILMFKISFNSTRKSFCSNLSIYIKSYLLNLSISLSLFFSFNFFLYFLYCSYNLSKFPYSLSLLFLLGNILKPFVLPSWKINKGYSILSKLNSLLFEANILIAFLISFDSSYCPNSISCAIFCFAINSSNAP